MGPVGCNQLQQELNLQHSVTQSLLPLRNTQIYAGIMLRHTGVQPGFLAFHYVVCRQACTRFIHIYLVSTGHRFHRGSFLGFKWLKAIQKASWSFLYCKSVYCLVAASQQILWCCFVFFVTKHSIIPSPLSALLHMVKISPVASNQAFCLLK